MAPSSSEDGNEESSLLDKSRPTSTNRSRRSPLWLLIFPEGTITSDEERVKSKRYAEREGIVSLILSPASTPLQAIWTLCMEGCFYPQMFFTFPTNAISDRLPCVSASC